VLKILNFIDIDLKQVSYIMDCSDTEVALRVYSGRNIQGY